MLLSQFQRRPGEPVTNSDFSELLAAVVPAVPNRRALRPSEPVPALEVTVSQTSDEVVVRVKGEARFDCADALVNGLLTAAARRPALVTLDLAELRFISSLAMGVLVPYRRGVVRWGGQVRLASELRPAVQEALSRAGLLDLFGSGAVTSASNP